MWYTAHSPKPLEPSERRRMRAGRRVGKRARQQFGRGQLIEGRFGEGVLKDTSKVIRGASGPLFEPAFERNGIRTRVDILRRRGKGWVVTEVKASTRVKTQMYKDLAYQKYLLEQCGLNVVGCELMHLNPDHTRGSSEPLFRISDLTADIAPHVQEVQQQAPWLRDVLQSSKPPAARLERQCKSCDYLDKCWPDLPTQSVFTLPRLHWRNVDALLEKGLMALDEVETSDRLKPMHHAYIGAVRNQEAHVDRQTIHSMLSELRHPIHFLDFETIDYAIPKYEGTGPWQQIPFQYSLHILRRNGKLEHTEYLHEGVREPRRSLAEHLVDAMEKNGSVVVYYAPFERGRLEELAEALPDLVSQLRDIIDRLWDQHEIFTEGAYLHPMQKGSTSIKNVVPTLAPEWTHDDLGVQDGAAAQVAYESYFDADASERNRLRDQMLAYCKRDTRAMVEIHRALTRLVDASNKPGVMAA